MAKETIYKCEECKASLSTSGVGIDIDTNGNNDLTIVLSEDFENSEKHLCGMEHLIKFFSREAAKWKTK